VLTCTFKAALAPRAWAVTVSVAALVAVTVKVAWPVESVVTELALRVLPALDASVTAVPAMPLFPESVTPTVYVPGVPWTRLFGPPKVMEVPTTRTSIVELAPLATAVTVIVRVEGSPATERVAVAAPLAPVTPVPFTVRPPELAEKLTGAPLTKLLLASFTEAVTVTGTESSELMVGELVARLRDCLEADTVTVVLPLSDPAVAVTLMAVPGAAEPAFRVTVTLPVESVVPLVAERLPADAENVTEVFATPAPVPSATLAVIVAAAEPSGGIFAASVVTARVVGVPIVVPPQVPVPPAVVEPVTRPQPLSPPQPLRARVMKKRAIIEASVRMVLYSSSCLKCCCD